MNAPNVLKALALAAAVGLGAAPAAAVTIGTGPLTDQPPLAPNLMLMVDDSGSMAWGVIPDYSAFLSTLPSAMAPLSGLRDSHYNGLYYNPATTYAPPPTATGGTYASNTASAFPNALTDPVSAPSGGSTNLTGASGAYGDGDTLGGTFNFYDSFTVTTGASGCTSNCTTTVSLFAYTDPSSATTQYVATDCTGHANCTLYTDTSGTAAPAGVQAGLNVMNWYSYYSTRMKTAKSSLLTALTTLPGTTRVGFGSTNGSAATTINQTTTANTRFAFTDDASTATNYLADVAPFGDGSSNTQKAALWNWAAQLQPAGMSPLRQALNAVGQYYQTAQPWASVSGSPLACRQAYTILTTDGIWNDQSAALPANAYKDNIDGGPSSATSTTTTTITQTASSSQGCQTAFNADPAAVPGSLTTKQNGGKVKTWTCTWTDSTTTTTSSGTVTNYGPDGRKFTYPTDSPGPYPDSYGATLADVAMYYWLYDLQPTLNNVVPTSIEDPAFWQHMTTFTLGLGGTPTGITPSTATPGQIFAWANGGTPITGFAWPQPGPNSSNDLADLLHAGINGHGGFFSASNPQALASSLESALQRVANRVGTGASLAANSTKLQTGTTTYQALYYTGEWKGDLQAYAVDPSTGRISTTPIWSASASLPVAVSSSTETTRNIVTCVPAGSGTCTATTAFKAANVSSLSQAEQTALGSQAASLGTNATAANVVDYLYGNGALEQRNQGIFRNRAAVLGDIVNSQPVYEGTPDPNAFANQTFSGSTVYGTFVTNMAMRTPSVWVAANDGMLHQFSASSGAEMFAYLPAAVITNATAGIAQLANPAYGTGTLPHQFFNDGQLTIADAYVNNGWATILVGTTGRGPAKAIYALNITDPTAPTLLWERSAADGGTGSGSIGQIIGKPIIALMPSGNWAVLVGNGYNSASGSAALLQFDLLSGALTVYATGSSSDNGLAAPTTWIGDPTNGVSTKAYAGDLSGNVWSFDLTNPGSAGTLMFTAKSATGTVQPITAGMTVGQDPSTGNVWLFFGTGEYLNTSDVTDLSVQSWYGLIVQAGSASGASLVTQLGNGRAALATRSIVYEVEANPGANPPTLGARAISTPTTGDMNGKSGWVMDLVPPGGSAQGERMVNTNQFQGNLLIGVTRLPDNIDACTVSGRGWVMAIDPFTGTNPSTPFFDLNGDLAVDGQDEVSVNGVLTPVAGLGFMSVPNPPIFVGNTMLTSFDNASTSSTRVAAGAGAVSRVSWREILQHP